MLLLLCWSRCYTLAVCTQVLLLPWPRSFWFIGRTRNLLWDLWLELSQATGTNNFQTWSSVKGTEAWEMVKSTPLLLDIFEQLFSAKSGSNQETLIPSESAVDSSTVFFAPLTCSPTCPVALPLCMPLTDSAVHLNYTVVVQMRFCSLKLIPNVRIPKCILMLRKTTAQIHRFFQNILTISKNSTKFPTCLSCPARLGL